MISEDLMIGDLVYYSYPNQFVTKVIDVCSHGEEPFIKCQRDLKDKLYVAGKFEDFHVGILRPIPLTHEILEKNGFKKKVWREYSEPDVTTYAIGGGFFMEVSVGGYWLVYNCSDSNDGHYTSNWIVKVEYVHKLQHLMRDLEIEKEITL